MDEKRSWLKSMGAKENKSQFPTLAVQGVLVWALLAAIAVAFSIVFANILCAAMMCPELDLTPVQDAELDRFVEGSLWLTVPHRRRSLASVALACAVVAHYMHARAVLVVIAATPEDVVFRVMVGVGAVFMGGGE